MDVEVVGGAVRGDGHAVPRQQRVVVDDREVGRGEADLMAEQCRAGLGPVEVMSVAGAQGRGGDGLAGPADRAAMLGQDGVQPPAAEVGGIQQFGIDLAPGDEVLTTSQDYPRMITAWQQRGRREKIVLKQLDLAGAR